MSERNIKLFVKICNEKGIAEGFKLFNNSNVITDINLKRIFYQVYFALNSKRPKKPTFNDDLDKCLDMMNLKYEGGIVYEKNN